MIGERSWLYSSFAFLHYRSRRTVGVRVGRNSGIYDGSFFELGPSGEVEIGDFCAVVGAMIRTDRRVVLEDYVFVAHEVVIADDGWARPPEPGPAPGRGSGATRGGAPGGEVSVHLRENCWIGARATLLGGADVGRNAVVGAAAVVDFEVPAGSIVAGNPARVVGLVPSAG